MLLAELTPKWSHARGGRQPGEPRSETGVLTQVCLQGSTGTGRGRANLGAKLLS
jgi:hypothetical protein